MANEAVDTNAPDVSTTLPTSITNAAPGPLSDAIQKQASGIPDQVNLHGMMQRDGMRLLGLDDEGNPNVRMKDGSKQTIDLKGMMQRDGMDPAQTKVLYNTASNPVQISPLSLAQYTAVEGVNPGLSNKEKEEGAFGYLRQNFDQVAQNDRGFTVQKHGVWYQVNPEWFGEGSGADKAEQFGKSLAATTAEILPQVLGHSVSAAVGSAAGLSTGAAITAGAMAAGVTLPALAVAAPAALAGTAAWLASEYGLGYLGGIAKTALGRTIGSYSATPEENQRDVAAEGLLRMAGSASGEMLRMTPKLLTQGVGGITKYATETVKDVLSGTLGKSLSDSSGTMRTLLDNAPEVGAAMDSALAKGGGARDAAVQAANDHAQTSARALADEAPQALTSWYGRQLQSVAEQGEGTFETNISKGVSQVYDDLREQGVVDVRKTIRRVETPAEAASGTVDAAGAPIEAPKPQVTVTKGLSIRPFSDEERAAMPGSVDLSNDAALTQVKSIVKRLQEYSQLGEMTGSDGVRALHNMSKDLNAMTGRVFDGGTTPEFQRTVTMTLNAVHKFIGDEFDRNGLGEEYGRLADAYSKYGNGINAMRKVAADESGNGAKSIVSSVLNNFHLGRQYLEGTAADMSGKGAFLANNPTFAAADVLGDRGTELVKDMAFHHTAGQFIPTFHMGLRQALITGSVAAGAGTGWLNPGVAAGLLTQSSPRLVAREARMASGIARPVAAAFGSMEEMTGRFTNSWLGKLTNPERAELLSNPDAMGAMFKTLALGAGNHQQMANSAQNMIDAGKSVMLHPQDVVTNPETAKSVGQALIDSPMLDAAQLHQIAGPVLLGGKMAAAKLAPFLGEKLAALAASPLIVGMLKQSPEALDAIFKTAESSPRAMQEIENFGHLVEEVSPQALKGSVGVHQINPGPRAVVSPEGKLFQLPGNLGHDSAMQMLSGKPMTEAMKDGWGAFGNGGMNSYSVQEGNQKQLQVLQDVIKRHEASPAFMLEHFKEGSGSDSVAGLVTRPQEYDTEMFAKHGRLYPLRDAAGAHILTEE